MGLGWKSMRGKEVKAGNLDNSLNEVVKEENGFWRRCEVEVVSRRRIFSNE